MIRTALLMSLALTSAPLAFAGDCGCSEECAAACKAHEGEGKAEGCTCEHCDCKEKGCKGHCDHKPAKGAAAKKKK
jgi:hypothetical protein